MVPCNIEEIKREIANIEARLKRNEADFAELSQGCPVNALGLVDHIAADRSRVFRLTMLMHALCGDWEAWSAHTADEHMQEEGFKRVSQSCQTYVRWVNDEKSGIEICDMFDIIYVPSRSIGALINELRRIQNHYLKEQ